MVVLVTLGVGSAWKSSLKTAKKPTEPDPDCPGPEIPRTVKDRNRGLVFGPSGFWKFQDREKTGLTGLNQSFDPKPYLIIIFFLRVLKS